MEELIIPKSFFCKQCEEYHPYSNVLYCPKCGDRLTSCWWALVHHKGDTSLCDDCKSRFWCWTNIGAVDKPYRKITRGRTIKSPRRSGTVKKSAIRKAVRVAPPKRSEGWDWISEKRKKYGR